MAKRITRASVEKLCAKQGFELDRSWLPDAEISGKVNFMWHTNRQGRRNQDGCKTLAAMHFSLDNDMNWA